MSKPSTGFDINPVRDELEAGALLLTPNNRLAQIILQAWGEAQAENSGAWQLPAVHSLSAWLESCWLSLLDLQYRPTLAGTVISPQQEQLLWQLVIQASHPLPPGSLPQQARQAYRTIQQWQISQPQLACYGLEPNAPFAIWIENFRQRLQGLHLITRADRDLIILRAFKEGVLPVHNKLLTLGFLSHSPLEKELLAAAAERREPLRLPSRNKLCRRVALSDFDAEITAAAHWAKRQMQKDPSQRLGIVIPQLTQYRHQIERVFRGCLEPEYWQPGRTDSAAVHYNISGGVPLSDTPVIAAALQLLELNKPQLSLENLRNLLFSPYWGSNALEVRSNADLLLCDQGNPLPPCSELRYQLRRAEEKTGPDSTETLSGKLDAMATLRREAPRTDTFSNWVDFFSRQLDCIGWPGYRSLGSVEYQQMQHWQQLLEQAASYNDILASISRDSALNQLRQLAAGVVFQAESQNNNLHVLGLLESAAIRFDKIWVIGLDDSQWPAPARLNPLLPRSLQQQLLTPKASPQQELQIAENSLRDLTDCCEEIIFSYSLNLGDQALQPSGLITDVPETRPADILEQPDIPGYPFKPDSFVQLEQRLDSHGPSLAETGETPRGGTALFSDQALCPFNSFARHRLGARNPPTPQLGLSPLDRGNIVHSALEILWRQLGNQEALLQLETYNSLIAGTIDQALTPWKKRRRDLFGPRFSRVEARRLEQLLIRWLEVEAARAPFQVQGLEQTLKTEFAGIPLHLRVDRIDATRDGGLVLIDYKTGNVSINSWLGERLEQPQLPLYNLVNNARVAATCFAVVNAGQCEFKGIGKPANLLPKLTGYGEKYGGKKVPDADTLQQQWRESLTSLAEEIKAGYAAVDFSRPGDINRQAELLPLNRYYQAESPT